MCIYNGASCCILTIKQLQFLNIHNNITVNKQGLCVILCFFPYKRLMVGYGIQ